MTRVLIFGNSGSGKSTLAKHFQKIKGLSRLDLDTIAWKPDAPTTRRSTEEARTALTEFTSRNEHWVIEGCYTDLLELLAPEATEIVFMNLSVEACINNARNRPWEPHKYESLEAQNKNLDMLIDWIKQYPKREDDMSLKAHTDFYDDFERSQKMYVTNNIEYLDESQNQEY